MGKQAKKRRQAAALAAIAQTIPDAPAAAKDEKPKHTHAPSAASDPVTGEAIDPARYHFVRRLSDVDESRPAHVREAIPTRIHSSQTERPRRGRNEPDGQTFVAGLGGNEFSSAFDRYMKNVLPRIIAEERLMWLAWWSVEYVVSRLVSHLGKETVSVAILVQRDGYSVSNVGRMVKKSDEWVCRQVSITLSLAARYFTRN